jgi:pyruvate dehydrogenase E1 component beta subunit
MDRDPLTFVLGEDVVLSAFGATRGLFERFGAERVRDTPISEAGFVGAAVGAAMAGMRPICEIEFAPFIYCCFDQIVNQAAKLRYMSGGQARLPITLPNIRKPSIRIFCPCRDSRSSSLRGPSI